MDQLDLFSLQFSHLPAERELARRFDAFNRRYFNGTLPPTTVRWSSRMRIAGTCDSQHRLIALSVMYHVHFPEDIDDTLKHEMIHLKYHSHGTIFRREAERVGATLHCKEYPGLHPHARFVYICPNCRTLFHRTKRERLYCGQCARDRLDPRFMLVLRRPTLRRRVVMAIAAKRPAQTRPRRQPRQTK